MQEIWLPDFILFFGAFLVIVYLATVFYDAHLSSLPNEDIEECDNQYFN